MTLELLNALEIPNVYRMFKDVKDIPNPPYAVWYIASETLSGSDYVWTTKTMEYTIELYTDAKNFELESKLEDLIGVSNIQKSEYYIFSENLYVITYKYTINKKRRMIT